MVEIIEKLKEQVTVQELCAILNVPRSTYYRWRQESKRIQGAYQLEKSVGELCKANKYRYGYRKITAILRQDRVVNHKAVQRIMQKYGWQCRVKVKKRKQTGQPYYVANNLMNREFTSQKRLEKLVTDITYLPFGGKTLYLSSILDLFNGEIIAYTISDTQNVNLVLDTLQQRTNKQSKQKALSLACPVKERPLIMPQLNRFMRHSKQKRFISTD